MMSRPPKPAELCESAVKLPEELDAFLYTLLTGNTQIPAEYPDCVRRLVDSFGQDIFYGVTPRLQKPPKQILLPYANVQLIQMPHRCGHGIVPFPKTIKPYLTQHSHGIISIDWRKLFLAQEPKSHC